LPEKKTLSTYAKNNMLQKIVLPFIFIFLLSGFNSFQECLYKNEKVIIYMKKGGIRMNFLFENFEEEEQLKVEYVFFKAPKVGIGTEEITTNKEVIKRYEKKYKQQILKHHINQPDKVVTANDIKMVNQIDKGKMHFYYYIAQVSGMESVKKAGNNKRINDPMWHFVGSKKFLVDIKINDELVLSKQFDLDNKKAWSND